MFVVIVSEPDQYKFPVADGLYVFETEKSAIDWQWDLIKRAQVSNVLAVETTDELGVAYEVRWTEYDQQRELDRLFVLREKFEAINVWLTEIFGSETGIGDPYLNGGELRRERLLSPPVFVG